MIGQRQQDCTAGAPTVQGRERAPDARTQPMREHHGGLRTHNTEQWGGGEGEAGPPYLSMGGWNSPVSQVIWVDHGGDIWVRDILNVAALGHPYQLIPKGAPPDRSPTALGWGTHQRIKDISHRAALCIGMLRSTMMRNTMITVNMIPITYHNDHTPTGNGGGPQDHVYAWTHNDLSRQALAPEPRASRSPNAAGCLTLSISRLSTCTSHFQVDMWFFFRNKVLIVVKHLFRVEFKQCNLRVPLINITLCPTACSQMMLSRYFQDTQDTHRV